jgi:hypothetical protein
MGHPRVFTKHATPCIPEKNLSHFLYTNVSQLPQLHNAILGE